MAADRIVVTATGILSALGRGSDAQLHALRHSLSGLRYPELLQTVHASEFMLGEVAWSNDALKKEIGIASGQGGDTRTTLLALLAIQELLEGIDITLLQQQPLAFINANTVGGMCEVEHLYPSFKEPGLTGDFTQYIDTLDCAESTESITRHFGLKPFMATISTACSSSGNSLILGARMIRQGLVERAICGGSDALSRFTLNGFHSLKNLDKSPCMPFDQHRFGLNLGEGAGYLLLEKESAAIARNANILAVFSGYSNTNDAYHPTAPSPDGSGAYRTMTAALKMAGLSPEDIGYINAHGTATINNDAAEGKAIQDIWNGQPPPFSATKPFTGHTLAAAGAIEAIFSILAMQHSFVPANLNFSTPMEELSIRPAAHVIEQRDMQHVVSNSFGFGGNNVSLVFSRP
jgi:3-oxoacyl-(acyl-carrier-protein) synthase